MESLALMQGVLPNQRSLKVLQFQRLHQNAHQAAQQALRVAAVPALVAATTTATTVMPLNPSANALIAPGDRCPEVGDIQRSLAELGYAPGIPDGIYGVRTQQAIEKFQTDIGLDADGVVGPLTATQLGLEASNPAYQLGSSCQGDAVGNTAVGGTASQAYKVTATGLNVRSGPGLNFPIRSTLANGTLINGAEETGQWLKLADGGYVSSRFVSRASATQVDSDRPERAASAAGRKLEVTASGLNVRSGPSLMDTIRGVYPAGAVVETTGEQQNGFVELTDGTWVSASFTAPAKPDARVTPLTQPSAAEKRNDLEKEKAADSTSPALENATDATREDGRVNTQVGRIAVYNSPNGQIVGTLKDGAEVLLSGKREGDWVQLNNGNWVSSDFVSEAQPSEPRVTPR
ncbi:MAG: SH3 domain-containing protein [Cyanobacteria bacterium P01_H01_bin.121]